MMFAVRRSKIAGKGTFATRDIKRGECVGVAIEIKGHTGNPDRDLVRTRLGKYTNHSHNPNMTIRKTTCGYLFVAKRWICKGQELTVNYHRFDFEGERDFK
jgi:hypothetical protein